MCCKLLLIMEPKHSRKNRVRSYTNSKGSLDIVKAREVARGFLQQMYSTVIFEEAVLKGNVWTVMMDIGSMSKRIIHVKVDAYTGQVLGYT